MINYGFKCRVLDPWSAMSLFERSACSQVCCLSHSFCGSPEFYVFGLMLHKSNKRCDCCCCSCDLHCIALILTHEKCFKYLFNVHRNVDDARLQFPSVESIAHLDLGQVLSSLSCPGGNKKNCRAFENGAEAETEDGAENGAEVGAEVEVGAFSGA